MYSLPVTKNITTIAVIVSIAIIFIFNVRFLFLHSTFVVFCDVGQGDSSYIRTYTNIDILIDTGDGTAVLECLGKYMPYYDKYIDLVIISHPQQDHLGALPEIIERYTIDTIVLPNVRNTSNTFDTIERLISLHSINIVTPVEGDSMIIDEDITLSFYWPTHDFIERNTRNTQTMFNSTDGDLNDYSIICLYKENSSTILYTGDVYPHILDQVEDIEENDIDILKVPHHGSVNGLSKKFLDLTDPDVSIISSGKNNSFGHPETEVLEMFVDPPRTYFRTDMSGDIVYQFPL